MHILQCVVSDINYFRTICILYYIGSIIMGTADVVYIKSWTTSPLMHPSPTHRLGTIVIENMYYVEGGGSTVLERMDGREKNKSGKQVRGARGRYTFSRDRRDLQNVRRRQSVLSRAFIFCEKTRSLRQYGLAERTYNKSNDPTTRRARVYYTALYRAISCIRVQLCQIYFFHNNYCELWIFKN